MASKTFSHALGAKAAAGVYSDAPGNKTSECSDMEFVESHGKALEPVRMALFGNTRRAQDRIHWMFPSDKDKRVAALLAWIQKKSYHLAIFGVGAALCTSTARS